MAQSLVSVFILLAAFFSSPLYATQNSVSLAVSPVPAKGKLLYQSVMSDNSRVAGWIMEGNAKIKFHDGWMEMWSPDKSAHHVFWCPQDFPDSFIATWETQNLATDAGLLIIFFAATGENGEDIFAPTVPARDGTFTQYTNGKIKNYHISYYANVAHEPGRVHANLRKNNTFSLLQSGSEGIPTQSTAIHRITLIKQGAHIRLLIDGRSVIDYVDNQALINDVDTGGPLTGGKIGFRQMQWSHFRYRNFQVWGVVRDDGA